MTICDDDRNVNNHCVTCYHGETKVQVEFVYRMRLLLLPPSCRICHRLSQKRRPVHYSVVFPGPWNCPSEMEYPLGKSSPPYLLKLKLGIKHRLLMTNRYNIRAYICSANDWQWIVKECFCGPNAYIYHSLKRTSLEKLRTFEVTCFTNLCSGFGLWSRHCYSKYKHFEIVPYMYTCTCTSNCFINGRMILLDGG